MKTSSILSISPYDVLYQILVKIKSVRILSVSIVKSIQRSNGIFSKSKRVSLSAISNLTEY